MLSHAEVFSWCQYETATPKTMTKRAEKKKRKENCNCNCSNVAQQMNGTHGRRKYFQMEKLQHSKSIHLRRVCDSPCNQKLKEKCTCEAARQGVANELLSPSPFNFFLSASLIVFYFLSLIFAAAAAGRYGRHTFAHKIACNHDENTNSTQACSHSAWPSLSVACSVYLRMRNRNGDVMSCFRWFARDTPSYRLRPCQHFINFKWQNNCIRFALTASIDHKQRKSNCTKTRTCSQFMRSNSIFILMIDLTGKWGSEKVNCTGIDWSISIH